MRLAFYTQHVLGMGHLFRSLEIIRALKGHEVTMITGGAEADLPLPDHAERHQLPGLMMDADFDRFIPMEAGADVEEVLARRRQDLLAFLRHWQPDVFLVELFPFGRKKFGAELIPALEAAKAGEFGSCRTACSVRDILVEKKDQTKFENRVLGILNPLFDALLVHADPELVRLEETFSAYDRIEIPVHHTGYVTPRPDPQKGLEIRRALGLCCTPLITVSAGSGSVGGELLLASARASVLLAAKKKHRMQLFTGPYMAATVRAELDTIADSTPQLRVETFAEDFPAWLTASDLSVSMAGYNTTMNLLAANRYGLVLPFDQNREQRMRAERLQRMGALKVLTPVDLEPQKLADHMQAALERPPGSHAVDLDGAEASARILQDLARH